MHLNCRLLFEKYARTHFKPSSRVLEIGPDKFPTSFQEIVADPSITWHSIDLYSSSNLTYQATSEYSFPIPDSSYDIIFAANVLEHVRKPWVWIHELTRICKPGGRVITINPVSWPFHQCPIDCWRAYPDGMRALYDDAELEVETCIFESLEQPGFKRYIPGQSIDFQGKWHHLYSSIMGRIGVPVEVAYDVVTIGRK